MITTLHLLIPKIGTDVAHFTMQERSVESYKFQHYKGDIVKFWSTYILSRAVSHIGHLKMQHVRGQFL